MAVTKRDNEGGCEVVYEGVRRWEGGLGSRQDKRLRIRNEGEEDTWIKRTRPKQGWRKNFPSRQDKNEDEEG